MHINVYILIPKAEFIATDPIDYMIQAYLQGVDYIEHRKTTKLNEESIEELKSVLQYNIEGFNEYIKEIIKIYKKHKEPKEAYFDSKLRYYIDIICTRHILTHQIYKYQDGIVPITEEEFKDISRNPNDFVLLSYDVHY